MGGGASQNKAIITSFQENCRWYDNIGKNRTDNEVMNHLENEIVRLSSQVNMSEIVNHLHIKCEKSSSGKNLKKDKISAEEEKNSLKSDEIRDASKSSEEDKINQVETTTRIRSSLLPPKPRDGTTAPNDIDKTTKLKIHKEKFQDSEYVKMWLPKIDADAILGWVCQMALQKSRGRQATVDWKENKYPLSALSYGAPRYDGLLALDRWGSYHESWCKVERMPLELMRICDMIKSDYKLDSRGVNSVYVNFYWDGESSFIPAHRDTTACLEQNSQVYCLSLGATREFILCSNDDLGKFKKDEMKISEQWHVGHGDLFAIGPKTNDMYLHAVPQDKSVTDLRVSIIFRSVDKSFIDLNAQPKQVKYFKSGKISTFTAACVVTSGYDDKGEYTHIADLIQERENKKREKFKSNVRHDVSNNFVKQLMSDLSQTKLDENLDMEFHEEKEDYIKRNVIKMSDMEDVKKFYNGEGVTVPIPLMR